jgi:molecular chaperone GrpE
MADQTTTAPPSCETKDTTAPAGDRTKDAEEQGPEAQAASNVLDDLESLRNRLAAAGQQRDENFALLQRTRADFENYQKRVQRGLADERRYAHGDFALALLPVLDNLQRALEAARQQPESGPLAQGVALVETQWLDLLNRFGILPIDALDQPFDPNLHEGVMQQPRSDVAPGTVIDVLQPGYRLHERVLRPARVVVSAPPANES